MQPLEPDNLNQPRTSDSLAPPLEPMSVSLMGKLFGVPLLIIGSIVGGAVLVVLLFAGPASPERRSIESLLQDLEASAGLRSLGVLLPKEKQLWQTALELAERLKKKDAEFSESEAREVTSRIASLVLTDIRHLNSLVSEGDERKNQLEVRGARLKFLIHALGRTQRTEAIEPLIEVVKSGEDALAAVAIMNLADMKNVPEARQAMDPIVSVLNERSSIETRLVACTALSVLADRHDSNVLSKLETVRVSSEGELAWSAALALARLGSPAGRSTLLDFLDREFWESADRYEVKDASGTIRRYRMPAGRVDELLIAGIEAVAGLEDVELRKMVERLESDRSAAVRASALKSRRQPSGPESPNGSESKG
jgi:hypothetical protein